VSRVIRAILRVAAPSSDCKRHTTQPSCNKFTLIPFQMWALWSIVTLIFDQLTSKCKLCNMHAMRNHMHTKFDLSATLDYWVVRADTETAETATFDCVTLIFDLWSVLVFSLRYFRDTKCSPSMTVVDTHPFISYGTFCAWELWRPWTLTYWPWNITASYISRAKHVNRM